jgi:Zn-dependent protease
MTYLLLLLPGAFLAPVIHEFVKARVSAALGDPTPRKNGFITYNPLKFFEPIGFIMMMVLRIGWGQPVTTSPFYYKDKRMGIALTYITPMVVNLMVGMLAILLAKMFSGVLVGLAYDCIYLFGLLNIRLAVFNLIPIHPMAMSKIIHIFVSPETSMQLNHREKYLQILLFFLIIFGSPSMVERFVRFFSDIVIRAVM